MVDRRKIDIERRKDVYIKEWGVKSRNNLVILWYTGS